MRWRSASALVVAVLALSCLVQQQQEVAAHAPQGVRVLVKHSPLFTAALQQRAAQQGLSVIGQAKGLLVLQAAPPARTQEAGARLASTQHAAHAADTRALLASLMRWPGVQLVEQDQPRFLQGEDAVLSPQQRRRSSAQPADCSASDVPLASGSASSLLPEIQPYGIAQIQADSKRLPSATDGAGVLVCIIDSGVDAAHQDFRGNALDGCKYEDAFAPGGCPFTWSGDMISHGTHVTGTISARRNGEGVVGVIPDGAEVYMVRVFNDSGDVNQGQGLVYGGTLILAYTQCEGRLAALQVCVVHGGVRTRAGGPLPGPRDMACVCVWGGGGGRPRQPNAPRVSLTDALSARRHAL
jgi:subtilisin family serine protease